MIHGVSLRLTVIFIIIISIISITVHMIGMVPYHETMPQDASQASLPGAVLALNSDTLKLERQKLLRAQETERCLVQYWAGSRKGMDKSLWLIGVQTWCWYVLVVVSCCFTVCLYMHRFI